MKKISKVNIFISFIISLLFVVGKTIDKYQTIKSLFSINNIIYFFIQFIFWYFITYFIYHLLKKEYHFNNKVFNFIFNKYPKTMVTLILFLIGLPIVITFYPGPVQWDGMWQLNFYSGILPWSNHHPIFSTFILGTVQKIGSFLIDDNFGIFLYTFPQYILSCYILSNILDFQKKLGTNDIIRLLTFLFFAISPSWYLYAYTFMKDTSYYLIFIIFFLNYIKYFYNDINKTTIILLLMSSILLILIRSNGIYVVSISMLSLLFLKKDYKKISFLFLVLFFMIQLILNTIIKTYNIEKTDIRETLSVPMQQIARYSITNELTEEENDLLNSLFKYDIEKMKKVYNKDNADPIKESLFIKTSEDVKSFISLWWQLLKKDPIVYLDATLNNTYGYFYPYKQDVKESIGYFRVVKNKKINKGNYHFYMNDKYMKFRNNFEENFYKVRRLPFIEFIYNTGTYFIILIILIGYTFIIKRKDYLIITIPLLMTYAFCILSPVNAYLRYMNPIIVCLPIYMALITSKKYNKI